MNVFELDAATFEQMITNFREDSMTPSDNIYRSDRDEVDTVIDVDAFNEMIEDFNRLEDDGQPSEYEEWQDYMGGDDWDHGQYDEW